MLSASDLTDFLAPHGHTSNADSKRIVSGCFKAPSPHSEVFPLFPSFLASNVKAVLGSVNWISVRGQGAAVTHAQCLPMDGLHTSKHLFSPRSQTAPSAQKPLTMGRHFSPAGTYITSVGLLSNLPLIFEIIVCYLVATARVSTDCANWTKAVRIWSTEVFWWEDCLCLHCHRNLLPFWSLDLSPQLPTLTPSYLVPQLPSGKLHQVPWKGGALRGRFSLASVSQGAWVSPAGFTPST